MSKKADALMSAKPGGTDWQEASPSARIVAAAFYELSASLDDIAEANDNIAKAQDENNLLADSVSAGLTEIADAIGKVSE